MPDSATADEEELRRLFHRLIECNERLLRAIEEVITRIPVSKPQRWYSTGEFGELIDRSSYSVREWARLGRINSRKRLVLKQATSSRLFGVKNRAAANRNERVVGVTLS